ncbi:peptidase S8/S53 domain-containing protein [Leptodontidium sp. MPI-SDFR-AT-0119]|nr:peptidase S8/S53 domain-containing protein [Leptodontidium sp. MPI-SDFR-AT-0119]
MLLFDVLALGLWICFTTSFTAAVAVSPRNWKNVLHERRHVPPSGWMKRSRVSPEVEIPIRIALKQSNLENLEEHLLSVSTPGSKEYGKHWSHRRIAETFKPSRESVNAIWKWLVDAGFNRESVRRSQSLGWLSFNATVGEVEGLLETEYWVWEHEGSGMGHVACEKYSVPEHVREHIDFITPTVHFDAKIRPRKDKFPDGKKKGVGFGEWGKGNDCAPKLSPRPKPVVHNLTDCANNIVPDCLRALYGIPELDHRTKLNPKNSFGVVQYTPQSYLASDLDMFFRNYSKNQVQKRPTLRSVDGGNVYNTPNFGQNIEANLDLEYAMALVNPLNVTLYQVGDLVNTQWTSFNNFLDSLDETYCSRDGQTENVTAPIIDAIYPSKLPGGFAGPRNCGGWAATKVISTSYSYNEHDLTPAYEKRQCDEYGKLGLAGTTFLYCSADYGVAASLDRCINPATGEYNDGKGGRFAPSFPSTCPYITSVGATQIAPKLSVTAPEIACSTKIYSGGGFSNVFSMPSYQSKAVGSWFKKYSKDLEAGERGFGKDRWNSTGNARAYPDVSANGAGYVVALVGSYDYLLYGTSASTPVFGAIVTLINEARMNRGKGSLGFLNPALYANPHMLNDITKGSNPGCGTDGFKATSGWDPVTGLGTPSYPRMLDYFLKN